MCLSIFNANVSDHMPLNMNYTQILSAQNPEREKPQEKNNEEAFEEPIAQMKYDLKRLKGSTVTLQSHWQF